MSGPQRTTRIILLLIILALASLVLACSIGSVQLSLTSLSSAAFEVLSGSPTSLAATIFELRLSRALAGFIVGATLALAGVMMQALLRNPLADPYALGVSGGAAVGALASMLLIGISWTIAPSAFLGALAIAFLLLLLAQRDLRGGIVEGNTPILLLTGVIIASGCGALVTLMLTLAPDSQLRGMVFWLIGDLSAAEFHWLPLCILICGLLWSVRSARAINMITMHAEGAAGLGVNVGHLRRGLFIGSALLTASAVSSAGSIGFVGLIVPHACRFVLGPDHRLLLPVASLVGGLFIVLADVVARTLIAPQQLPVGVITALIGVPVFLLQLHHISRK